MTQENEQLGKGGTAVRKSKFSVNALLLLVIIFSAIIFFVTIKLVDLAYHPARNDYYHIEGTDCSVRYSSLLPDGIYTGDQITGTLRVEGRFGYDWGAAAAGDRLYINEYVSTDLGLMLCNLVRVDLETWEKETLLRDTVLQGTCASGELVCVGKSVMPAGHPGTNALARLYAMSEGTDPSADGALILYLDPESGEIVWSVADTEGVTEDFEAKYLARTLEEVRR